MTKPNQHQRYADRVAMAKQWLGATDWMPTTEQFDYAPLIQRARAEFGYDRNSQAEALIHKAARLLRGDAIALRGHQPKQFAQLKAPLGAGYVVELKALDATIYIEAPATILNGDGTTLEWQFKMESRYGEIVDVIGTLRPAESGD